jgi:hypothetical protein
MHSSEAKFLFERRCFHTLSKIQTKKEYIISLSGHDFYFTFKEICLIAPRLVEFYQQNQTTFILLEEKSNESNQLVQAMEAIQSLLVDKTYIEISHQNEKSFSVLADKFNNGILRRTLSSYTQNKIRLYSLNFEILSFSFTKLLNNFTLVVNNIRFSTNLFYLCCISSVILKAFLQQSNISTFQIEIVNKKENEVINCVASFMNFINGNSFSFTGFSSDVFFHVIEKLGIIGFEDLLLQLYPVPIKFKDAIHFLQCSFATSLRTHFQKSIEIVSSKFYKFNVTNLPPFPINIFESLLCSLHLKITNETTLFQIISENISKDCNLKCLIKYVHFTFMKPDLVMNFYQNLS